MHAPRKRRTEIAVFKKSGGYSLQLAGEKLPAQ